MGGWSTLSSFLRHSIEMRLIYLSSLVTQVTFVEWTKFKKKQLVSRDLTYFFFNSSRRSFKSFRMVFNTKFTFTCTLLFCLTHFSSEISKMAAWERFRRRCTDIITFLATKFYTRVMMSTLCILSGGGKSTSWCTAKHVEECVSRQKCFQGMEGFIIMYWFKGMKIF